MFLYKATLKIRAIIFPNSESLSSLNWSKLKPPFSHISPASSSVLVKISGVISINTLYSRIVPLLTWACKRTNSINSFIIALLTSQIGSNTAIAWIQPASQRLHRNGSCPSAFCLDHSEDNPRSCCSCMHTNRMLCFGTWRPGGGGGEEAEEEGRGGEEGEQGE